MLDPDPFMTWSEPDPCLENAGSGCEKAWIGAVFQKSLDPDPYLKSELRIRNRIQKRKIRT